MWRPLEERDRRGAVRYHVWHHPQEGVIRLGPDGAFRETELLTEVDSANVLDVGDGAAEDAMEVRVDGRRVRVRYAPTDDVDLSQLEDSAQISRMVRSDPFFQKRADFKTDCAKYAEKACAAQGCFYRHGSWGGSWVGGRQFYNTCEDIQTACAQYATMDDKARQELGKEQPQDITSLERRCGGRGAGLGAAYREQRDAAWQANKDTAFTYAKYAAMLAALVGSWSVIYPMLTTALPTLAVPSLADIREAPSRAITSIKNQLGSMWPAVTEQINSRTGVDLNDFTNTTPTDHNAPPEEPLVAPAAPTAVGGQPPAPTAVGGPPPGPMPPGPYSHYDSHHTTPLPPSDL